MHILGIFLKNMHNEPESRHAARGTTSRRAGTPRGAQRAELSQEAAGTPPTTLSTVKKQGEELHVYSFI